ncbi:hypothetical protein [Archangium sp.]|uniref:hypothetical protein n=1 Tax=Archangium sp. TaxID=1872627 RepID=UPI003899B4E5
MAWTEERILILCKTYPSPSLKYTETSCVAGINELDKFRRLYPVPFRLIRDEQQFKKWQWINARIYKSNTDNRPESHKIYVDTIRCDPNSISTQDNWRDRRKWLEKLTIYSSFEAIESRRSQTSESLALLRPKRLLGLDVEKAESPDWTEDERAKLLQAQVQGDLFDQREEAKELRSLRKLPFDFYYRYECDTPEGPIERRHKLVDWEVGALYWNCRRSHGNGWEEPFRARLETEFASKDLMILMGNIHRFQHQWLIISLIYPPKQRPLAEAQGTLF